VWPTKIFALIKRPLTLTQAFVQILPISTSDWRESLGKYLKPTNNWDCMRLFPQNTSILYWVRQFLAKSFVLLILLFFDEEGSTNNMEEFMEEGNDDLGKRVAINSKLKSKSEKRKREKTRNSESTAFKDFFLVQVQLWKRESYYSVSITFLIVFRVAKQFLKVWTKSTLQTKIDILGKQTV
jgi:hypothetical protein